MRLLSLRPTAVMPRHRTRRHRTPRRRSPLALLPLALLLLAPAVAPAQAAPAVPADSSSRTALVTHTARGTFDVAMKPMPADDYADGASLGRMSLDKRFHGDLDATGKGQMLTALTPVKGSAGYVAIERVAGTLGGRRGTFVFQHSGIMERGAQRLTLVVVPDSGTDELTGVAGAMTIEIANGVHSYVFEYTLPAVP